MSNWREPTERLDFDSFCRRHADWLEGVPAGPLYCLPEKTITRLGQPHLGGAALLDELAVQAERDLLALCQSKYVVGFEGHRPIAYPPLTPTLPLPPRSAFPDLGWSDTQWQAAESAISKVELANERLAGYAGWLATEPPFLDAVRDLAERWRKLPDTMRPGFPLLRPTVVTRAPEGSSTAPEAVQAWAGDFADFCDRWGLVGMATWDLPSPQGPLLPSVVPMNSPALPARGVSLILPIHYHVTGDHDLMKTILEHQQALAAQVGLDPSVAGLPHYKLYAQILQIVHQERTIRGRYAPDREPRGFVRALTQAIAEELELSVDHVTRIRKAISRCLRGERSKVRRLRPPKS
jgi:hypothetical protein